VQDPLEYELKYAHPSTGEDVGDKLFDWIGLIFGVGRFDVINEGKDEVGEKDGFNDGLKETLTKIGLEELIGVGKSVVINEEKGEGTKVDLEVLKVGLGVLF
jgi:hypothetical protein